MCLFLWGGDLGVGNNQYYVLWSLFVIIITLEMITYIYVISLLLYVESQLLSLSPRVCVCVRLIDIDNLNCVQLSKFISIHSICSLLSLPLPPAHFHLLSHPPSRFQSLCISLLLYIIDSKCFTILKMCTFYFTYYYLKSFEKKKKERRNEKRTQHVHSFFCFLVPMTVYTSQMT